MDGRTMPCVSSEEIVFVSQPIGYTIWGGASDEKSLQLRKLLGRFVSVCNTIQYAHSRGVLHRDLKPSNIMLGDYGETLVVDWGLAKVRSDQDEAWDGVEVAMQLS